MSATWRGARGWAPFLPDHGLASSAFTLLAAVMAVVLVRLVAEVDDAIRE